MLIPALSASIPQDLSQRPNIPKTCMTSSLPAFLTITRPCDRPIGWHCVWLRPTLWPLWPLQTAPALHKTRRKVPEPLLLDSPSECLQRKRQWPPDASYRWTPILCDPLMQCDQRRPSNCPIDTGWTPKPLPTPFSPEPCAQSHTPIVPAHRPLGVSSHA